MMVSCNSKYDKVRQGKVSFSSDEADGYELFKQKCASCHSEPLFTNYQFVNNGLDSIFSDLGRGKITFNANDNGKFKVPSLRNVELTYPYMHDGRFWSLNDVLDHYDHGIKSSSTLAPSLQNGIPLTVNEKTKLIAFLKTLTDYDLLGNSLFY
jgi:cytochrome c peroxidase